MQKKRLVVSAIASFLITGLYIPLFTMDSVNSTVCTVESKIDAVQPAIHTVESKLCILETDAVILDSKIDLIDTSVSTAKACTIESKVDLLQVDIAVIESTVDGISTTEEIIESKIDRIERVADSLQSKVCRVDSAIDILADSANTIESYLDTVVTIESKVESVSDKELMLESKVCIIDSKVEVADGNIDTITRELLMIDSRIDILDEKLDEVVVSSQTLESTIDAIHTAVCNIAVNEQSAESKLCLIDSKVEVVDSELDSIKTTINTIDIKSQDSIDDFQETWTAITPILEKLCTVQSKTDVVSSILDVLEVIVDQSGTSTEIAAILEKTCIVDSQIDEISKSIVSFDGTFSVLDDTLEKLCDADSLIDELDLSTTILDPIQSCLGTPIRQEDVGTTGFTISTSGRYYLAENITFSPSATARAITISADNVYLDLSGKVLQQGNIQADVAGILVDGVRNNIVVAHGCIHRFTNGAVQAGLSGSITNIILKDLLIEDIIGAGATFFGGISLENGSNIIIDSVEVVRTIGSNILAVNSADIIIENTCVRGSSNHGIHLAGTDRVRIRKCASLENSRSGVEVQAFVATTRNVLIEHCTFMGNGFGIRGANLNDATEATEIIIRKNDIVGNGYGVFFAGVNMKRWVIMHNMISNNSSHGIEFNRDDTVVNNIVLFNSLIQNGLTNIQERSDNGPNSILGNFALHSIGDARNYSLASGNTVITGAKSIISQGGAFPNPLPTYWYNISMTT